MWNQHDETVEPFENRKIKKQKFLLEAKKKRLKKCYFKLLKTYNSIERKKNIWEIGGKFKMKKQTPVCQIKRKQFLIARNICINIFRISFILSSPVLSKKGKENKCLRMEKTWISNSRKMYQLSRVYDWKQRLYSNELLIALIYWISDKCVLIKVKWDENKAYSKNKNKNLVSLE